MNSIIKRGLEMTPDEMRSMGRMAVETLVERISRLGETGAWDGEFRQVLEEKFLKAPPEQGRPAKEVMEQVARDVLPYAARLDHPRFFGFVPSSPTWPGVLADFLAAGFHINSCTWLVASGTSQLELVVVDWICRWVGYPENAGGLLTSGGSAASVEAMVTAREAAGHPERPTVYMSDQSHSAFKRAALIAGIRREHVRLIPTDEHFRMDVDELARQVSADRAQGLHPVSICANAGSTSTGSIDPLQAMADFGEAHDIWLHVDAAYGGFAMVTEEGTSALEGIERADSIGLDPHKWFFQPFESGALVVKNATHLENAFAIGHDVLQDTVWGANHPNFSDRGQQLSRTARALKIWMSVQTFGMGAFREAVQNGLDFARKAEAIVRKSPMLETMAPLSLSVLCFRVNPSDRVFDEETLELINRKVLAHVFWDELAFISSTSLKGVFALRICITNHTTTWEDVRKTLELVTQYGEEVVKEF